MDKRCTDQHMRCPSWCHEGSLGSMLQRCVDMRLTSELHLDIQTATHPNTKNPFLTSSQTQTQTKRNFELHPVFHMFIHLSIHLFVRECCIGSMLQRGPDMCVTFEINLDIHTETHTNTSDPFFATSQKLKGVAEHLHRDEK